MNQNIVHGPFQRKQQKFQQENKSSILKSAFDCTKPNERGNHSQVQIINT